MKINIGPAKKQTVDAFSCLPGFLYQYADQDPLTNQPYFSLAHITHHDLNTFKNIPEGKVMFVEFCSVQTTPCIVLISRDRRMVRVGQLQVSIVC